MVFENADISYERLASGLVFEYANRHFLSTPSKTDFTFFVLSLQTVPKSKTSDLDISVLIQKQSVKDRQNTWYFSICR